MQICLLFTVYIYVIYTPIVLEQLRPPLYILNRLGMNTLSDFAEAHAIYDKHDKLKTFVVNTLYYCYYCAILKWALVLWLAHRTLSLSPQQTASRSMESLAGEYRHTEGKLQTLK